MIKYDILFSTPHFEPAPVLHAYLATMLPSYTLSTHDGSWQGQPEHSYTVTLIDGPSAESTVITVAKHLKEHYQQESVLITKQPIDVLFV